MSLWGRKEADREAPACSEHDTGVERSFDDLARSIAGGTMPRRRALRLFGAALAGTVMASIPGVAWAQPCQPAGFRLCGKRCCPEEASCVRGRCVCLADPQGFCEGQMHGSTIILCCPTFTSDITGRPTGGCCRFSEPGDEGVRASCCPEGFICFQGHCVPV